MENKIFRSIKKATAVLACSAIVAGSGIIGGSALSANAASKLQYAVNWAVGIANDNTHGYSQTNRNGNPDYDCSSLVISALRQAGIDVGNASYTGNMKSEFMAHGFTWIPISNISGTSDLKVGDVLFYRSGSSGHTEMYIGNGKNVGAHSDYDGKKGDSSGREINTQNFSFWKWQGVLRYNDSTGGDYYPKCGSQYNSIVDALNSIGVDSSFANRQKIAAANSISNYTGTPAQNTQMLNLLKQGKLKKPGSGTIDEFYPKCGSQYNSIVDALNSIGVDSSFANRKKIAAANSISNYSGTAAQNTQMLNLLKQGKLKKA